MFFDDNETRRPTPTKALKKIVYTRDSGKCKVCGQSVDPFSFEIGHNLAHSKGGKLTVKNAILLCSTCNKSMRTLSLKEVRKKLGISEELPNEKAKKALKKLTIRELKFLAKAYEVKVKGRVSEGFLTETRLAPSKLQYINALSKALTPEQIEIEKTAIPKPVLKKKKRRSNQKSSWLL